MLEEADYAAVTTHCFGDGDLAVITTDGFFEAMNFDDEQFGVGRVLELLHRDRDLPAAQIIENLHEAVVDFTQGLPQADDLTAVVIRKR